MITERGDDREEDEDEGIRYTVESGSESDGIGWYNLLNFCKPML